MECKRFENVVVVRLDPGDEICESLLEVSLREKIEVAEISGIGAVNDFNVGTFNTQTKNYYTNEFKGSYEIISLTGNLTRMDGRPYLHAHIAAADKNGNVVGGHLNKAVIANTAEIFLHVIPGTLNKKFNDNIGINLFDFK